MKKAIVTGASSGIGRAIASELCDLGYEVYGFGRDFSKTKLISDLFHPVVCDITDTASLEREVKKINAGHDVTLLVNNAGVGYYGLHEELTPARISAMVRTNLEAPIILAGLLLRDLKQNAGTIINISSVTAGESNPHGCAYGATKAGLTGFSRSLFDEARKTGLRVVTIEPDMTATNLYRNADFTAASQEDCRLSPEDVASAVRFVLEAREGSVISLLRIQPQKHRIEKKGG